jgi:hypothetical protein
MIRLLSLFVTVLGWVATAQQVSRPRPPDNENRYDTLNSQTPNTISGRPSNCSQNFLQVFFGGARIVRSA